MQHQKRAEAFFKEQRAERKWRESLIKEAVAEERERCARVCEELAKKAEVVCMPQHEDAYTNAAIKIRGEEK